jgi:hypothetical protein
VKELFELWFVVDLASLAIGQAVGYHVIVQNLVDRGFVLFIPDLFKPATDKNLVLFGHQGTPPDIFVFAGERRWKMIT